MRKEEAGLPKTVELKITQKDIDEGKIHSGLTCPVARAGRRAFNKPVFADTQRLLLSVATAYDVAYMLGRDGKRFIRNFDRFPKRAYPTTIALERDDSWGIPS
jgi:hypothetical protein